MNAEPEALHALERRIADLHAQPRLRVWSLVVTLFGDAILPRGGRTGLAQIQTVMERIGVDGGAVRTAMSRLASDGWVTREKEGRLAFYRLAAGGRHAFDEATRRIYAAGPPAWDGTWDVLVSPADLAALQADGLETIGFMRAGSQVFLRAATSAQAAPGDLSKGMLTISGKGSEFPPDLASLWSREELAGDYRQFLAGWSAFAEIANAATFDPLSALAARILLIHDWRRLVLRDPCLPDALNGSGWPSGEARILVRRIYAPLAAASEAWLDGQRLPPQRDPLAFAQRFGIQPAISNLID